VSGQPSPASPPAAATNRRRVFLGLVAAVACLRLYYCACLPVNTGDVLRHLAWGCVVNESGYAAADRSLADNRPAAGWVAWSDLPFNYPIGLLFFDQLIARAWGSIFFMKLALTLLEGLSALLVYRHTREKWLAFMYWASPISIWWCSHEGQIEPLQNVLAIAAVSMLERRLFWANLLLALAVQIKLTAAFFLPLFLRVRMGRTKFIECAAGGLVGTLPTVFACMSYSALTNLSNLPLRLNPYYFNPFERSLFLGSPVWLTLVDQLATYGALIALSARMIHDKNLMRYVPAVSFFVALKFAHHAQPWYMLLATSFFLALDDRRLRFWLFLLAPLLDVWSLLQMIVGPFGYTIGGYYDGLTVGGDFCKAL